MLSLRKWFLLLLGVCSVLFFVDHSYSQDNALHIDTVAGVRFRVPFPVYQKKSALQIENLIRDAATGDWQKSVNYSSAIYSDNSDAYIVVWRQSISELPTRYQFKRLEYFAPMRAEANISDVEVSEDRSAATYSLTLPKGIQGKVAMLLTKTDNVFIGLYSKNADDLLGFANLLSSIEIDPKRQVHWSDLSSGLKPVWSGVILGIGFLLGFIVYLLAAHALDKDIYKNSDAKKSGDFISPDQHLNDSRHIPKSF
jgi:hypothetical protein